MGLKTLIDKQVDKAFVAVGDLAVDVTLVKKSSSKYNFQTQKAEVTTNGTLILKGIIQKKKKESQTEAANTYSMQVAFKTKEFGDISAYDTATINNLIWKINPIGDINDFITTVTFVREK